MYRRRPGYEHATFAESPPPEVSSTPLILNDEAGSSLRQDRCPSKNCRKRVLQKKRFYWCVAAIGVTVVLTYLYPWRVFRIGKMTFPRWNDATEQLDISEIARKALDDNDDSVLFHRVYMVRKGKLWVASVADSNSQMILDRARFTEPTMTHAVSKLPDFVFFLNYGDSTFCCNSSTPIVTLSAPIDCQFSWPMPNYETIIRARKGVSFSYFGSYFYQYPHGRRTQKAVWRGSPTGDGTRIELCEMHSPLLDAKLVGDPEKFFILRQRPDLVGERMAVRDFQNYVAVVDLDGNSWSSRFGMLLCYSSVVLKVQPRYVDYFYDELTANVHYIPVRADLSDLEDQVEFVLQNPIAAQDIVKNANAWCFQKMRGNVLERDMATILRAYATRFPTDASDKLWRDYDFELARKEWDENY